VTQDAEQPFRATLSRSVGLFSAFRKEQTEPDVFYGALARDSAAQVASYLPLDGARLDASQNARHLLQSFFVLLSLPKPEPTPGQAVARESVLTTLQSIRR